MMNENQMIDSMDGAEPSNQSVIQTNCYNYLCRDCGTKFMNTSGDNVCAFCGSRNVNNCNVQDDSGLYYLPFSKNINDAVSDYSKKLRFNILIPFSFKKKSTYSRIKKVYLPVTVYDSKVSGDISFYGGDKNRVNRGVETRKYEVGYNVNLDYNNVLVSRLSKINEDIFSDVLDYNFDGLAEFSNELMNEATEIVCDLDDDASRNKNQNKLMKSAISKTKENMVHELKKLKSNEMQVNVVNEKKVLVPVFLLGIKYRGKDYIYMMNGQNGNSSIDLEVGIINIIMISILVFLFVFGITYLIAYFL